MLNKTNFISEYTFPGNIKEMIISGDLKHKEEINPYSGFENIEFQKSSVRIKVPKKNTEQNIKLLVCKWSNNELETQKLFSINGTFKVPNKRIIFNNDEKKFIPWRAVFVDVLIAFDKSEFLSGDVNIIRIYLAPANYKKFYQRLFSQIMR
jgi:hypothetical protein